MAKEFAIYFPLYCHHIESNELLPLGNVTELTVLFFFAAGKTSLVITFHVTTCFTELYNLVS